MIGAGTFINPLLKIVTTVAILAAVYFFFVKPILDTTNDTIDRAFDTANPAIRQAQKLASPGVDRSIRKAQRLARDAQQASDTQLQQAHKLLNCITDASGNVDKIQACNAKFAPG
jgi:hypothetical protein